MRFDSTDASAETTVQDKKERKRRFSKTRGAGDTSSFRLQENLCQDMMTKLSYRSSYPKDLI